MKPKTIILILLSLMGLVFFTLFFRQCKKKSETKPETVTLTEVNTPPVVAPKFPSMPVPDSAPSAEMQAEIRRYKERYLHYKSLAADMQNRIAILDAALANEQLTCEEKQALLKRKLEELDAGAESAAVLIDDLNEELSPRRDTGRVETDLYRFAWQIDHFGRILPGGFMYDIDVKSRTVTCPDCPPAARLPVRNITALYGYDFDLNRMYALEARRQWRRMSVSGMVGYGQRPFGMLGVGLSW